jgi:DNA-binding transcriptional LysR family regulator
MAPIDPITLRLFIAVCEEGNIARAAAREALVASAVSKRIAAVEAQVGTALLVRGRRGIQPTAAGLSLLRQARELLSAMARMQAELSEFASGVMGSVGVLASPSVLAEELADDIGAFLAAHPRVRVTLDERVSPEIVRAVREGAADLGVLWDLSDTSGLHTLPYRQDRLCVAVAAGHALAGRKTLRYAAVLEHIDVGIAPGGMMDVLLRREAARLGRTLVQRVQVSGMDAAARIVAAGLGAAVLPREAIAGHASAKKLVLIPLADAWSRRRFVVVARADGSVSATARLLMQHLHGCAGAPAGGVKRSHRPSGR